ncbi:hypothetical protein Ocin01_03432 [Orchesella cincta]|uniref:Uncharacterized protein n=1 Tax=Orchesella cincta TaxID=48709 RepID=A0A1D2NDC7_ORCCI|nr:hypothetical protein Ocin01_03432 [Orchesella cincta]
MDLVCVQGFTSQNSKMDFHLLGALILTRDAGKCAEEQSFVPSATQKNKAVAESETGKQDFAENEWGFDTKKAGNKTEEELPQILSKNHVIRNTTSFENPKGMGKVTRIFYAILIAYLVPVDTFQSVFSSPTPTFPFWSTDSTTTSQQDGNVNVSSSPFGTDLGDDVLCHPSCECLDTFFDCRKRGPKRGLTEFPDNFPNWVVTL